MQICIWSGLGPEAQYTTGVGKHIVNMSLRLARAFPGGVEWLVPRHSQSDLQSIRRCANNDSLNAIPQIKLPVSRRFAEAVWQVTKWPSIDDLIGKKDWVYCPKEAYAPVKSAQYAVTVHDLYALERDLVSATELTRMRWHSMLCRALDQSRLVITVSDFTKSRLIDLLAVSPAKIRVVGNGVDEIFFGEGNEIEGNIAFSRWGRFVLAVGGLTQKKGADDILQLAEALRKKPGRFGVVVVGPVDDIFRERSEKLDNLIVIPRGIDNSKLAMLMRKSIAVLMLSLYEGFGIPSIEAMAVGTPVIAANRSSLPEIVGDAGILINPTQYGLVADIILDLAESTAKRDEYVRRGQQRAACFTWSRAADRLRAALEEFS